VTQPACKAGAWRHGRFDPCHTHMFYCEPCREAKQWPESGARSRGTCEECGVYAYCYDVPSGVLANWGAITESLAHPETYVRRERPQRKPS
jgi:hypothetical protein